MIYLLNMQHISMLQLDGKDIARRVLLSLLESHPFQTASPGYPCYKEACLFEERKRGRVK
jgi:hypothetical protein